MTADTYRKTRSDATAPVSLTGLHGRPKWVPLDDENGKPGSYAVAQRNGQGRVGVVLGDLGDGTHLAALTLKGCIDPKTAELAPYAADVIQTLDSAYVEAAPANGLNLLFRVAAEHTPMLRKHLAQKRGGKPWSPGKGREMTLHLSRNCIPVTGEDFRQTVIERAIYPANDNLGVVTKGLIIWLIEEAGPAFERDMNGRYAVVRHGGRTLAAEFKPDGDIDLGPVDDLHKFFANNLVLTPSGKGWEPASKAWMRDPKRRTYPNGIVFDPSGREPAGALNLWTGWAIQPKPGASCKRILAHIRHVICNGDAAYFAYVIGWLADIVQRPGRKPGVALVLQGGKGAGKDTLAYIMRKMIGGRHVAHIIRPDALTSRFNAPMATALLAHIEESYWAGDPSKKGTLQALITAERIPIERKGIDAIEVDSFVRLLLTTNEDWAVPASADERRYAAFQVSGHRMGDREYFKALYAEIDGDGAAAFLSHLLAIEPTSFDVRDVPQTGALRDQKIASLRGPDRWIFELLHKGELGEPGDWEAGPVKVEKGHVRGRYEVFCRENRNQGDPVNPVQFGHKLKAMFPDLTDYRPHSAREDADRPRMYIFPPLAECRNAFEKHLSAPVDWGDGGA